MYSVLFKVCSIKCIKGQREKGHKGKIAKGKKGKRAKREKREEEKITKGQNYKRAKGQQDKRTKGQQNKGKTLFKKLRFKILLKCYVSSEGCVRSCFLYDFNI